MNFRRMIWLRVFLIFCLLAVQAGFAQIRANDVIQHDTALKVEFDLPDSVAAVLGSTTERKAAWDALSEEERAELFKLVGPYLKDSLEKSKQLYESNGRKSLIKPPSQIGYVDWNGVNRRVSAKDSFSEIAVQNSNWAFTESLDGLDTEFVSDSTAGARSIPAGNMPVNMPVNFSETLADLFTPYYHVSSFESAQFATFQNNQTKLIVEQYRGQTPQSYYRVHPMGFAMENGIKHGFFRLDYLTLWDYDTGLAVNPYAYLNLWIDFLLDYDDFIGPDAFAIPIMIFNVIDAINFGHESDPEHSAILVGAPVVANDYNPNPGAYYAYDAYVAAHEGTFFDTSMYSSITTPIQGHIEMFLSLGKHGTYFGNPDGLPLMPAMIINECFYTLQMLYLGNVISFSKYTALAHYMETTFFMAVVERFVVGGFQGLTPAVSGRRINV